MRDLYIRPDKVRAALLKLKAINPHYKDIDIDNE